MAARRLIAAMLVLLFLSSLAAALAPVEQESRETTESTEAPPEPDSAGSGELLRERLDAAPGRRRTIEAKVGDQLQLRVSAPRVGTVQLVDLGADEDVAPGAPARFDVLLSEPERFPVEILETGRKIGEIVVSPRAPKESDPARARDRP